MSANAVPIVLRHAARLGERAAFVHYDADFVEHAVSYAAFAASVDRSAAVWQDRGVAPGDRVCLLMNDSPAYCAAFLGIVKAGGVAVALNTRLSEADYAFVLADSAARFLLVDEAFLPLAERTAAATGTPLVATATFLDECAAASGMTAPVRRDATDPAFWLYSSGTTGHPKAIVHSHANLAQTGKLHREFTGVDEHATVLSTSKLFFAFPLDNAFLGTLAVGATSVINTNWPDVERVIDQVARHRPAVFFSVPSFFRRMLQLDAARLAAFRHVRLCYTGGERLPESIFAQWKAASGAPLLSCYGMSETFLNMLAESPTRQRPGSCGIPLADVETRLVDRDGRVVGPGETGTLWIRFPWMTTGYRRPELNAQAFRDGWFCTNDLFLVDEDGFFWHQGRADELLKVAGQWVKPMEVEEAALATELVRDAACVVVPDADGFERLALFVVPADGAVDVIDRVVEAVARRLPRHSQPKWVRAVHELPRTPTGKVQRFRLRESLLAERAAER